MTLPHCIKTFVVVKVDNYNFKLYNAHLAMCASLVRFNYIKLVRPDNTLEKFFSLLRKCDGFSKSHILNGLVRD